MAGCYMLKKLPRMKNRALFWSVFILVSIFCWVDYQYFTEGHANRISPLSRQIGHIVILCIICPIGYYGWKQQPFEWAKRIWLFSYISSIIIILIIGFVQWKTGIFGVVFLDQISSLRLFFCSPVPYFMLYVLNKVISRSSKYS